MKKAIDGLILIMLCIFLFTGCQQEQIIHTEEIANASKIECTHYINGISSTKTIENTDTINQIANWLNELLLFDISFAENETPSDTEGGESYSFHVYESEQQNDIDFSYIMNSNENCYIHYNNKWYTVTNPNTPVFINDINTENQYH